MGGIIVRVCYRIPDQEEQLDEAFFRQMEIATYSQNLVLMGDMSHRSTCWRGSTAGYKPPMGFPESINDIFLRKIIEGTVLCWTSQARKVYKDFEGLEGLEGLEGRLGCSN